MESPQYIQTSLAAAISLGFENGSFKEPVKLTGLNLLLTYKNGCIGKCAYCGISALKQKISYKKQNYLSNECIKEYTEDTIEDNVKYTKETILKKTFIRVKWPIYKFTDVLAALKEKEANFKRVCISMITHKKAVDDTIFIINQVKKTTTLPISILITPTLINSPSILEEFKKAGAEMIGVAIDTATKTLFEKYRGKGVKGPHKWEKYWEVLKWAVSVFGPYKVGIHLIIGLGETQKEAVEIIYKAHKLGVKTHLFSFYPEKYTRLEEYNPPLLSDYRKIQIVRYLINEENLELSNIYFNENGKILKLDYDLEKLFDDGIAFMTSGCPCQENQKISACNRPFANERPSEAFRNYPYLPRQKDLEEIKKQVFSSFLYV